MFRSIVRYGAGCERYVFPKPKWAQGAWRSYGSIHVLAGDRASSVIVEDRTYGKKRIWKNVPPETVGQILQLQEAMDKFFRGPEAMSVKGDYVDDGIYSKPVSIVRMNLSQLQSRIEGNPVKNLLIDAITHWQDCGSSDCTLTRLREETERLVQNSFYNEVIKYLDKMFPRRAKLCITNDT